MPGTVAWPDHFHLLDDDGHLRRASRLIREFHDAVAAFAPPPGAQWQALMPADGNEIIAHHDLAPWNLVIGDRQWAFIDWDTAAPGTRLWDLAYVMHGFVPLSANPAPPALLRFMIAGVSHAIDYTAPGPLTDLAGVSPSALARIPGEPAGICRPVHALVIQPRDAQGLGLADDRFAENQIRPAAALIEALLALDPAPLDVERTPERRVIGTCRHFAVLSCALLRYRGIAARVRCGFATYFQPRQGLDHWITEYWHEKDERWVRIDSEILGQSVLAEPEDLRHRPVPQRR